MRGRVSPRTSLKVVFTSCSGCFQISKRTIAIHPKTFQNTLARRRKICYNTAINPQDSV